MVWKTNNLAVRYQGKLMEMWKGEDFCENIVV
jgi:hypothetical protein